MQKRDNLYRLRASLGERGNIPSSHLGLGQPTGYNLFTLKAVEFTASRQQAAAEMAN